LSKQRNNQKQLSNDKFDLYAEHDGTLLEDDVYAHLVADFDPKQVDRQARRKRKPKVKHIPKKDEREILDEIADTTGIEGGFETTYNMTLYEEEFLLDSVRTFYERDLVTDILAMVKGGKEASVYRCRAHPTTHTDLFALKVYRPRKFRNLRNDKLYRQGRQIIGIDGKGVKERDQRMLKAIAKGTGIGQQMSHTSWLMYEFKTLDTLYKAGADVPQVVASGHNALLMTYIGDEHEPAPTLHEVRIHKDEAQPLFQRILRNVDLLMSLGYVHGDLSAYNILYWQGEITLIDFPQVVDIHANPSALKILKRDIQRVLDYFSRYGIEDSADYIAENLWAKHVTQDPYEGIDLYEGLPEDDDYEDDDM
jgi:RIO kinase 1